MIFVAKQKPAPSSTGCRPFLFYILTELVILVIGAVLFDTKNRVHDNTEYKSASDSGYLNYADVENETAYSADKYGGNYEEIAVIAKVNGLKHLKTGNCDESV